MSELLPITSIIDIRSSTVNEVEKNTFFFNNFVSFKACERGEWSESLHLCEWKL